MLGELSSKADTEHCGPGLKYSSTHALSIQLFLIRLHAAFVLGKRGRTLNTATYSQHFKLVEKNQTYYGK